MQLQALITQNFRAFNSDAGFTFRIQSEDKLAKKWVVWTREFESRAKNIFQLNGSALCHEMAKYSLPTRANTALTANDAINKYAAENQALAGVAFKPQTNRSPEFWVMSGYFNIADYVMKRGFPFMSQTHQRLAINGKWALLQMLMEKKGFKTPEDAPSTKYVVDDAKLGDFILWKSQYKKNPKRQPYYVKNKATIQKIAQEKSLNNYASVVINGWLKAAKGLGNKLPSGVQHIKWPKQYDSLGWGSGKIEKYGRGQIKMTITNKFANQNRIFYSQIQQAIFKRRIELMNKETLKMFQDMISYWDNLVV